MPPVRIHQECFCPIYKHALEHGNLTEGLRANCSGTFRNKDGAREHVQRVHVKALFCKSCHKRFGLQRELGRHQNGPTACKGTCVGNEVPEYIDAFSKQIASCQSMNRLSEVLFKNGVKQYDVQDETDNLDRGVTRDPTPADSIPISPIPPSNNLLQRYPQGDLPSPLPALCPCPVPEGDPFWDIKDPDHPSPNQLYLAYHLLREQSTQLGGVDGRSNEGQHQQIENIAEPPYSSNSTQNPFLGDLGILYRDLSIGDEAHWVGDIVYGVIADAPLPIDPDLLDAQGSGEGEYPEGDLGDYPGDGQDGQGSGEGEYPEGDLGDYPGDGQDGQEDDQVYYGGDSQEDDWEFFQLVNEPLPFIKGGVLGVEGGA